MPFADDVVDWITGEFTTLGLSTSAAPEDEVEGNGYTPLALSYTNATGGSADLTATLEFDGPPSVTVTHALFRNATEVWIVRPLNAPLTFNAEGRLNITTAEVDHTILA